MFAAVAAAVAGTFTAIAPANAAVITSAQVVPTGQQMVGSGNGTLNLILFNDSNGGAGNSSGAFNADNANTDMPAGSAKTTANVTYVTSVGELRNFYTLNFPNGSGGSTVSEVMILIDLNETGSVNDITLNKLDIVTGYNAFTPSSDPRNDPAANDITSNTQNDTGTGYSGGTLQASLDGPKVLPLNNQGGGFADHVILTGVNPFDPSFTPSTRILFHWESTGHDSGGETVFLSGALAPVNVPEPTAAGLLLAAAGLGLAARRRRPQAA